MKIKAAVVVAIAATLIVGSGHFISDAQAASLIPYPFAGGVPAGTFIGFEDLALAQGGDFDYNDDSFVFTNVTINLTSETPLPAAFWLFAGGLGLLGMFYRKKEKPKSAWT